MFYPIAAQTTSSRNARPYPTRRENTKYVVSFQIEIEKDILPEAKQSIRSLLTAIRKDEGKKRNHHKPWFDRECKNMKARCVDLTRSNPTTPQDLEVLHSLKKASRILRFRKRDEYETKQRIQLIHESVLKPWIPRRKPALNPLTNDSAWISHFSQLLDRDLEVVTVRGQRTASS